MARTSGNPLEGKTQAEIDTVMSKRLKDMNEEEMRVYKRVKYDAWILKNPDRAPKKKKAEKSEIVYKPINFVQEEKVKKNNDETEVETEETVFETRITVRDGKIPRWATVEPLNDKQKEWSENRQILVLVNGVIKVCRLNWLEGDEMPTITCPSVNPFFLPWPIAYCAIRYAFVRIYERDAIMKETSLV